jgi:hypothetical protein
VDNLLTPVDPMKPLGQPVGKRFVGADYAGYIVGFDHRRGVLIWFDTKMEISFLSPLASLIPIEIIMLACRAFHTLGLLFIPCIFVSYLKFPFHTLGLLFFECIVIPLIFHTSGMQFHTKTINFILTAIGFTPGTNLFIPKLINFIPLDDFFIP